MDQKQFYDRTLDCIARIENSLLRIEEIMLIPNAPKHDPLDDRRYSTHPIELGDDQFVIFRPNNLDCFLESLVACPGHPNYMIQSNIEQVIVKGKDADTIDVWLTTKMGFTNTWANH